MKLLCLTLALALSLVSASGSCPSYKYDVIVKTSYDRYGLRSTVDKFRQLLGGEDNGNNPGPISRGQRSINWDAPAVPFNMPFDFFKARGALFHAKGGKFAVSNPPEYLDDKFDSINPCASKDFITFSPKRLFTPVLENKVSVRFTIPGSHKKASVSGFGAVFTDVDLHRTTFLTLKDRGGCIIAKVAVPPLSKGLSFVGVIAKPIRIPHNHGYKIVKAPAAKVEIKLGNIPITKKKRGDIVVNDDFIYGEPQAM